MKIASVLIAIVSLAVAAVSFNSARLIKQSSQTDLAAMQERLDELNQRLDARVAFDGLLDDVGSKTKTTDQSNDVQRKARESKMSDRVRNQGRANDVQSQDIEYLKKQRLYHKQLIDQINADLVKLKRESRESAQTLRNFGRGAGTTGVVTTTEFAAVKRRVDELYRRIQSGR